MKIRKLLEFTVDTDEAAAELASIISAVLVVNPGRESAILSALDQEVGEALARLEESGEEV